MEIASVVQDGASAPFKIPSAAHAVGPALPRAVPTQHFLTGTWSDQTDQAVTITHKPACSAAGTPRSPLFLHSTASSGWAQTGAKSLRRGGNGFKTRVESPRLAARQNAIKISSRQIRELIAGMQAQSTACNHQQCREVALWPLTPLIPFSSYHRVWGALYSLRSCNLKSVREAKMDRLTLIYREEKWEQL